MKHCNFIETFSAYQSSNIKLYTVRFYIKMIDSKDLMFSVQTGTLESLNTYVSNFDLDKVENIAFEYVDEIDVGRIGFILNCLEEEKEYVETRNG